MENFWCEIDLSKLERNLNNIKERVDKKIMAVVKGNAYGLGIENITGFLEDKVDYFAVSTIDEAKKIKSNKNILVLTPIVRIDNLEEEKENIIFTIDTEEFLDKVNKERKYKVHIYVDTGMNRFGVKPDKLKPLINKIKQNFPNIIIDGIYTHLHNSKDVKYTLNQIKLFEKTVLPFKNEIPNIHCLSSSGITNSKYYEAASFTNIVRIGNLLYGYIGEEFKCEKIFKYCARIVREYYVNKGEFIGYGNKYKACKDIKVGIISLGHIDHLGYYKKTNHCLIYHIIKVIYRWIKNKSNISFNGKDVKIINGPFMNNTLIDMEDIDIDSVLEVDISPILADSSISKRYIK